MKQNILKILYKFLGFCTRIYLMRTKPIVIGITGSVGKTSCRMIVTQVLQQIQEEKKIYTSPKNFNSELGLIFSIFCIEEYDPSIKNLLKLSWDIFQESLLWKKKYDILIAEYGIDTPGDMDFLLSVMKPSIGIITKLDSVHSDNFPRGIQQLWQDKFKLLLASKQKTYFNMQDIFSKTHENLLNNTSYIFEKEIKNIKLSHTGDILKQTFSYNKKTISINIVGKENVEYTRLSLEIAEELGIKSIKEIYDFSFLLQSWRFSVIERNKNIFIDSTYNAGPESMKQVILNTQQFQKEVYPQKKLIYVLGDMREIGDIKQQAHEELSEYIQDAQAIFTVGPEMYQYLIPKLQENWFRKELHSSLSSREIGVKLKKYLKDNNLNTYIILFKGSQNTIFTEEALASQLTPTQQKNLPRNSEDWKKKKEIFFKSL